MENSVLEQSQYLQNHFGVAICLGAELEFYLRHHGALPSADVLQELTNALYSQTGLILEPERGSGQYELALPPSFLCPNAYAHQIEEVRHKVSLTASSYGLTTIFAPKPFAHDHGSALHIHISLHTHPPESSNLFAKGTYQDNTYLQRAIYGILAQLHNEITTICTRDDMARLSLNNSVKGAHYAPTGLCWGGNNRTAALRIPDSLTQQRRIEFRVPSANCCPWKAIWLMLSGVAIGFEDDLGKIKEILETKYLRIYGNAYEAQYNIIRFDTLIS